jgi:hypothetical protein
MDLVAKSGLGAGFARGGGFLVLGLTFWYNNSTTGALGLEFLGDVDNQGVHRTRTL